MNTFLSGVTVPLATPLTPAERLDTQGLARLLEYTLAAGVHNLFVFGTNGEFAAFSAAELEETVTATRRILGDRQAAQRLLVGIGAASLREALSRGRAAIRGGADALVACSPYYFVYKPQELEGFFRQLADQLERPIVLYNCPRYTGNPLTPDIVARLAGHPNIVGIKDSSGDQEQVRQLLKIAASHPGFQVSQGDERKLVWAAEAGVHGITPGLANLAPHICVRLWESALSGKHDEAEQLQARLDVLRGIHMIRSGVAGTKAALEALGICGPTPMAPFVALNTHEKLQIREILASVGVMEVSRSTQIS